MERTGKELQHPVKKKKTHRTKICLFFRRADERLGRLDEGLAEQTNRKQEI